MGLPAPALETSASRGRRRSVKPVTSDMVTVGKDVLELLSSAMYVDPLTIYREYVQNAADAIDDARADGVLGAEEPGEVALTIDATERSIRIRDNGSGIAADRVARVLLSIGASGKRGTSARGFRGVGRLAGLAYCRQLTFRTRAQGDAAVTEVTWDCVKLKSTLRDARESDDLPGVMERIVSLGEIDAGNYPEHFFEVELSQVVRLRRDVLLNPQLVGAYLSQVAPVPFHPDFEYGERIRAHLAGHVRLGELRITLNDDKTPLTRPHRDRFPVSDTVQDRAVDLQLLSYEGDDGISALGWVLHHGYLGHISVKSNIGGLRLRAGNIQVGGPSLVEDVFPEPRFNGWAIGEIHVVDPRILPNARRDHFEQNTAFSDLTGELLPLGRAIAKRCRTASVERHREREAAAKTMTLTGTSSPASDQIGSSAIISAPSRGVGADEEPFMAGPTKAEALSNSGVASNSPADQLVLGVVSLLRSADLSREEASSALALAVDRHFGASS